MHIVASICTRAQHAHVSSIVWNRRQIRQNECIVYFKSIVFFLIVCRFLYSFVVFIIVWEILYTEPVVIQKAWFHSPMMIKAQGKPIMKLKICPDYGVIVMNHISEKWFNVIRCPPKGKWYCPSCRKMPKFNRQKKKK